MTYPFSKGPTIPTLLFDAKCAICSSFARLIRKGISTHHLHIKEMNEEQRSEAKDFWLITPNSELLKGREAVHWMAQHLPESKQYFWMLPDRIRHEAAIQSYGFVKWIRKLLGKRGCNCEHN